jgi:hypothetical protein
MAKRKRKTKTQVQNTLSGGEEPTFEYDTEDQEEIAWYNLTAYNWYNQHISDKKKKDWIVSYAKQEKYSKEDIESLKRAPNSALMTWDAIYARSLSSGAVFSEDKLKTFKLAMRGYILAGKQKKEDKQPNPNKKTVQDYMNEKVDEYITELDIEVDAYLDSYSTEFSLFDWLKQKNVPATNARRLAQMWIDPMFEEIAHAIKKTDDQVVEAYSYMSDKQKNAYAKFLLTMKKDVEAWANTAKKTRKPRKKKAVPVSKKVAKVTYKERADEFKVASIDPKKIIDANVVWLFNANTRDLTKIVAKPNFSLDIKGTTLQNVDTSVSYIKRLRKPTDVLPTIVSKGKRAIENQMKDINAKQKPVTSGRINKHMIILRAF